MFLCFEAVRENFCTFSTFRSFKQALSSGDFQFNRIGSNSRVSIHVSRLLDGCDLAGHIFASLVPI